MDADYVDIAGNWCCTKHNPSCVFRLRIPRAKLRPRRDPNNVTTRDSIAELFFDRKKENASRVVYVQNNTLHKKFKVAGGSFERVPGELPLPNNDLSDADDSSDHEDAAPKARGKRRKNEAE